MPALLVGFTLGFSAGISPGPLMSLVITTALERGVAAGLRVAVAPLITDAPIILLTTLLFNALPRSVEIGLAVAGGLFVIYLGAETLIKAPRAALAVEQVDEDQARHIWRGALVNMLSPHPWLFWIAVGSPLLVGFWRESPSYALAFLVGFYALLVGSKVGLAMLAGRGRDYLTQTWYRRVLAASGVLLIVFGALLVWSVVG